MVDGHPAWVELADLYHPDDPVDAATGIGCGRRILFQRVPESKQLKNRLHLDLQVGPRRRDAEVTRLTALGAIVRREIDDRGARVVTMTDLEGNEFDVI